MGKVKKANRHLPKEFGEGKSIIVQNVETGLNIPEKIKGPKLLSIPYYIVLGWFLIAMETAKNILLGIPSELGLALKGAAKLSQDELFDSTVRLTLGILMLVLSAMILTLEWPIYIIKKMDS